MLLVFLYIFMIVLL